MMEHDDPGDDRYITINTVKSRVYWDLNVNPYLIYDVSRESLIEDMVKVMMKVGPRRIYDCQDIKAFDQSSPRITQWRLP